MMRCIIVMVQRGKRRRGRSAAQGTRSMHGYYLEDLEPGMKSTFAKTVTEADIVLFAGISGDTNPVHLNQEFARRPCSRAGSPMAC